MVGDFEVFINAQRLASKLGSGIIRSLMEQKEINLGYRTESPDKESALNPCGNSQISSSGY